MKRERIIVRQRFTRDTSKPVKGPLEAGNRVHEKGAPTKFGRILELGLEVSGVKFDTGEHRFISNDFIVNLGTPK